MVTGIARELIRLAGVLWLVAFYGVAGGLYPQAEWLAGVFWEWGYPLAVALAALLAGARRWPVVGKPRDPMAGMGLSWGLAGCLLLVPLIVGREEQLRAEEQQRAAVAELREEVLLEQSRKQAEERMQALREKEEGEPDRFDRYEGRLPAEELERLRELDRRLRRELREAAEAYRKALENNPVRGPMEWMRMGTVDALETELARHRRLYEKTRAFTEAMEGFEERYLAAIEELGVGAATRRVAVAELERILQYWHREGAYDLRKLDVQLLATAQQALRALRDNRGAWEWDARSGRPRFFDEEIRARFGAAVQRMEELREEVRRIREEPNRPPEPE